MAVPGDQVDATVKSFTQWARTASPQLSGDAGADAEELRLLLGMLRDQVGVGDPADLRPGDLRELLLRVYPREVMVLGAEDTEDTIPAVRDLLMFLADTGAMTAETTKRLGRELDEAAPHFTDAVLDPGNWKDADLADDDDFELDDDDDFEPDDDDIGLKEAFGLPDRLPPVRLPAEPELAAMSRTVPLLEQARMLAEWTAPGRDIVEDWELTAADTMAAARELGITVPGKSEQSPGIAAIESMLDVPELTRLWEIALDVGFVELEHDEERAGPGEAMDYWPGGTDEESLDVWCAALASALSRLEIAAQDAFRSPVLDFEGAGGALIIMLFLARAKGVAVGDASALIKDVAIAELEPAPGAKAWRSWTSKHGDPAEDLLGQLAELGAVSLADEPAGESSGNDRVARLTPLGTWAIREQLVDEGVDVPLLPPTEQMAATDLLAAAEYLAEEETEAETAAWLELRSPDVAATELLAAAADGGPVERLLAVATVNGLGTAAEAAWRDGLGRPELRPYAKIALTEIAGGEPGVTPVAGLEPELPDLAWLLIDLLAALSDDPDELPQQIRDAIPPGQEQEVFDAVSRSPHPDAASVLSLIGDHHPDKRLAKAARKSAFLAASRPKPSG